MNTCDRFECVSGGAISTSAPKAAGENRWKPWASRCHWSDHRAGRSRAGVPVGMTLPQKNRWKIDWIHFELFRQSSRGGQQRKNFEIRSHSALNPAILLRNGSDFDDVIAASSFHSFEFWVLGRIRAVSGQRGTSARRAGQSRDGCGEGSRGTGTLSEHLGQTSVAAGEDAAGAGQSSE